MRTTSKRPDLQNLFPSVSPQLSLLCAHIGSYDLYQRQRRMIENKQVSIEKRPCYVEKFENAALCLWFGIPSKLIRQENGAFRKQWRHNTHMIFLKHKSKMTKHKSEILIFAFLNSFGVLWTKITDLMCFQSETSVLKFHRRSVDGKHFI